MTFRNTHHYKHPLNIQIQESQSHQQLNHQDNGRKNLSQSSDSNHYADDDEQNLEDEEQDSEDDFLEEDHEHKSDQNDEVCYEGSNYLMQQNAPSQNDSYHQNQQYQPPKHQEYLIPGQDKTPILPNYQPPISLKPPFLNNRPHTLQQQQQQQKDPEVQKIIQNILDKRKQKQIQKHLLADILNSNKKSPETSSLFRYQSPHNKTSSISLLNKINETYNVINRNHYDNNSTLNNNNNNNELITKCKQLESKIRKLAKKKTILHQAQTQKQQHLLKHKQKSSTIKTKQQLVIQKLQNRLSKALQLNTNLTKRIKLQKSKLSSILLSSSHQKILSSPTIILNQQSTIQSIKQQQNNNGSSRFNSSHSPPTNYKSPILQFNSYLINQSLQQQQKQSSSSSYQNNSLQSVEQLRRQNIYIQDDMMIVNGERDEKELCDSQLKRKYDSILLSQKQQQQKKKGLLKELMGRLKALNKEEKQLMEKLQQNDLKIREYQNQQYNQCVA